MIVALHVAAFLTWWHKVSHNDSQSLLGCGAPHNFTLSLGMSCHVMAANQWVGVTKGQQNGDNLCSKFCLILYLSPHLLMSVHQVRGHVRMCRSQIAYFSTCTHIIIKFVTFNREASIFYKISKLSFTSPKYLQLLLVVHHMKGMGQGELPAGCMCLLAISACILLPTHHGCIFSHTVTPQQLSLDYIKS